MRNDKLIPGLILVVIGAAFLLHNYGYLHFHLSNIFRLWPIFLVIGGVNLVFANNKSHWATILKIAVVIAGFGLLLFGNFGERYNFWPGHHFRWSSNDNNYNNDNDDNDDDDDDNNKADVKTMGNGAFNEPYKAGIKSARLVINGGATSYKLSDTTNQFFNAITADKTNRYTLAQSMDDSVYVLDFNMKDHHGIDFDSDDNWVNFRLNPNPEWEVNVETGASSVDFDLSKFKVRELKLHGGAASFHVKLGAPLAMTDVDVSTGVSEVVVDVPQNAACSIDTDSGLSGNDFPGFTKNGDDHYETPGYQAAKNKIHIHISGGLSDFSVKRY